MGRELLEHLHPFPCRGCEHDGRCDLQTEVMDAQHPAQTTSVPGLVKNRASPLRKF